MCLFGYWKWRLTVIQGWSCRLIFATPPNTREHSNSRHYLYMKAKGYDTRYSITKISPSSLYQLLRIFPQNLSISNSNVAKLWRQDMLTAAKTSLTILKWWVPLYYVIWKKSCKFWNKTEYGLNNDRWRWYSLPDNTQKSGDTPSYRIMLLWGVFWDGAFKWLAMVLITLMPFCRR